MRLKELKIIKMIFMKKNILKTLFLISIVVIFVFGFSSHAFAAITYQAPGAVAYSASTFPVYSISPDYPSSVASGDLLILLVGMKPITPNVGTVITPSGWTSITSLVGAGGYGTTLAGDTGNTNIFAFYKIATGSLTGSLTVNTEGNNVSWAQVYRFSNATSAWSIAGTTGSDTSAGDVSILFGSDPGVTIGDYILGAMVIPTDVTTPIQFSVEALVQTGITFDVVTEINEPDSTNRNDIGGFTIYAPVSLGTSSDVPTMTATAGGTTTNVRGPGVFIRIRESASVSAPTVTTQSATNIKATIVLGNGTVTNDGNGGITEMGIVWDTSTDPTTSDGKVVSSGGNGMFITSSITGLEDNTLYYARAYAINSAGTSYGDNVTFTTTSKPTIALNTTDATNFGTDSTPTLEMTASDVNSDIVQYNMQIHTNDNFLERWVVVGQGTNSIAYSTDGITWTGIGTSIFSSAGYGVAWNGTSFVAVGASTNTIAYSTDGITWTGIGSSVFSTGRGVAWNGTSFVAVGAGTNSIAYSTDGITWTGIGTSIFSTAGYGVAWNGTRFVAVGEGTNSIAHSTDGITWTGIGTSIFVTRGYGVAWNGTRFVAGGSGTNSIAYSTDGISWTGIGSSVFSSGRGVAWNGTSFVAVGASTNSIAYSTDGITWTGIGTSIFSTGRGVASTMRVGMIPAIPQVNVTSEKKTWVAVGRTGNSIAYSFDGISWTGIGTSIFSTYGLGVAWNGTRFVATGAGTNSIAYSTDGISWTGIGTAIFSTQGNGVAWNGTRFVATGSGTNTIAYSTDGISWTGIGTAIFSTSGVNVAWNGTIFVAVGQGTNSIAYSSDGISWTGIGTSIFSTSGYGVAWNGTRFVAVGNGTNSIAYSTDGISWTGIGTTIFSTYGRNVAWNGTSFVAVGGGTNTIAYSTDGINWSGLGTTIFDSYGNGISWNGEKFVAVGWDTTNNIAYSYNGISWIKITGKTIFSTAGYDITSNSPTALTPLITEQGSINTNFINTISGSDYAPFNQGEKVSYTVPAGSELAVGTYYWRARAKDPFGSNEYSSWTATRSFIISPPGINISGTANGNDNETVKIAINGTPQAQVGTIESSAWTITSVAMPTVNDIITVWVDSVSDANESTGVTKWSAGDVTGMVLNTNVLSIGSNQNTSLTVTNLGQYDADNSEDVMHTANSSAVLVPGASNLYNIPTLSILAGSTLAVGNTESVTTGLLDVAGTLTSTGNASYELNGTTGPLFTKTGTFIEGTSTVTLSGEENVEINSSAITFYNLTSSTSGVKKLGEAITIASGGALTVSGGTFDPGSYLVTGSGSNSLNVGGNATIFVGASTFTGNYSAGFTTITLDPFSTVDYSLNGTQTIDNTLEYSNLSISNGGTKTLAGATTVNNNLAINAGTLDDGGYQITGNGTGIFEIASGATLNLGSAGTATIFPTGFTVGSISLDSASTVNYKAGVNQTVSSVPTYGNLIIATGGTKTPDGDITAVGSITVTDGVFDTIGGGGESTSTKSPGTVTNVVFDGSSYAFINLDNAKTSNDSYATSTMTTYYGTDYIYGSNFNFNIPTDATIDGIEVSVEAHASGYNEADGEVHLVNESGNRNLTDRARYDSLGVSDGVQTFGGATDLWNDNSETWTPAKINDIDFGVQIYYYNMEVPATVYVDHIEIKIYYTTTAIDNDISAGSISIGSSGTLTANSSLISLTGTSGELFTKDASGTFTAGTSTIKFTDTGNGNVAFSGGGGTYNNLWFSRGASTGDISILGSNTFTDFKDDGSTAHSILFTTGTDQTVGTFTVSGTEGNSITLKSTLSGAPWTLTDTSGTNDLDYLSIRDSIAEGGAVFQDLTGEDLGSNMGWIFGIQHHGGGRAGGGSEAKQCNDGIDNDGDEKIDFGGENGDSDCSNSGDDNESSDTSGGCANGANNPPSCTTFEETKQCNDDIDNDGDGKTDFDGNGSEADPDCSSAEDDNESTDTGGGGDPGGGGGDDLGYLYDRIHLAFNIRQFDFFGNIFGGIFFSFRI